ncbi:MAG: ribonuclease HI family protein [Ignavibacteriae bacterium]|nr:ribonuclease HI family protein [Ignavibacteriota bacterium]MCB0723632.1 ribonuclease HI family protein [Ignavibacteriota bacterium]MCB9244323.1 ribonuclease HI family protein [Ignavibacteriales bacterium]
MIKVHTDGASRGNPGDSAIGIAVFDSNNELILSHKEYIGKNTNNYAEYYALVKSAGILEDMKTKFDKIEFYSDSELMVNQLTGKYIIRNERLRDLSLKFKEEIRILGKPFEIFHVSREDNKDADKLANEALNEVLKPKK